ncbi:hypothetical protein DFH11DRAFT_1224563 [Phellopilus nigrolimitatus]|nr:hypothetical protein DFH11DRAFT_1224563 [Phellopilus nigrolimitatus]
MHTRPPVPVVMSVSADGATAGPVRTSPARSGAAGLNLESPVQATRGALLFFSPSTFVAARVVHRQPTTDSATTSLTLSSHSPHVRVSRPCSARDGAPLGLNHLHDDNDGHSDEEPARAGQHCQVGHPPSLPQLPPPVAASPPALRRTSPTLSRDEDQSMDQSMSDSKPALASPPLTLLHAALPPQQCP